MLALIYPCIVERLQDLPLIGDFVPRTDSMVVMIVFTMMAIGLNIVVGYAGLLDLGYVAFYAAGAYTAGWLASGHFDQVTFHLVSTAPEDAVGIHISMWLVLIIAGVFTTVVGILIGLPTLRLRGDYLAIVTLGFGEIVPQFVRNGDSIGGFDLTNGTFGISPIDSLGVGRLRLPAPSRTARSSYYWTAVGLLLLHRLLLRAAARTPASAGPGSPSGRTRPRPRRWASRSMRTKTWSYAIGAFFGGVAGAFYASFKSGAFPADFYFNISVFLLCMVILGGMGSLWGVILGGMILGYLNIEGLADDRLQDPGGRARLRPDEVPVRDLRRDHRADDALPPDRADPRAAAQDRDGRGRARHAAVRRDPRGHADRTATRATTDGATGDLLVVTRVPQGVRRARRLQRRRLHDPARLIVSLIGPNGAGKTTFFNQLTGVYHPTSGSIVFDGTEVAGMPPHASRRARRSAAPSRTSGSSPQMTAIENVLVGMHAASRGGIFGSIVRTPKVRREEAAARERARELLVYCGLPRRHDEQAGSLPYGDQRRLEVARALATEPKLLLLDEPTAGMNPQETAEFTAFVRRVRDEKGLTVLLIEHDMKVVMGVSERSRCSSTGRRSPRGRPPRCRRTRA